MTTGTTTRAGDDAQVTTTSTVTSGGAGPRSRDEPSGPGNVRSQLHLSADDSRLQMAPDEGRVPSRNPRLPSDGARSAPGALSFLNRALMSGTYRFASSRTLIRDWGAQRMSRT